MGHTTKKLVDVVFKTKTFTFVYEDGTEVDFGYTDVDDIRYEERTAPPTLKVIDRMRKRTLYEVARGFDIGAAVQQWQAADQRFIDSVPREDKGYISSIVFNHPSKRTQ